MRVQTLTRKFPTERPADPEDRSPSTVTTATGAESQKVDLQRSTPKYCESHAAVQSAIAVYDGRDRGSVAERDKHGRWIRAPLAWNTWPRSRNTTRSNWVAVRAQDFATNGDLVSARLLLRRAAEAGSAEAALALGETFDPVVFQRLHVIGIEPDAASAQKWYQRAAELGSAAASQHLATGALRLSRFSRELPSSPSSNSFSRSHAAALPWRDSLAGKVAWVRIRHAACLDLFAVDGAR